MIEVQRDEHNKSYVNKVILWLRKIDIIKMK